MTAFVACGLLVYSILHGNGGAGDSQEQWQQASERAITIDSEKKPGGYLEKLINDRQVEYIDQGTTSSLPDAKVAEPVPEVSQEADEEPSVLALIRKNAGVAPGVSSGTARVSVIVEKGDTLFNISQRHGISVTDLARLNSLTEPYTIKIGQTLYVAR